MMAADAREYVLALDFDANLYSVSGNGLSETGSISSNAGVFSFQPGNATGPTGVSTTRFTFADGAVVGEYALPGGAVPFVATRSFLQTVAETVGTYNLAGRTVDTAGGAPNTTIQQARITSDGRFITCDDIGIFTIEACPPASQTVGTVTVANGLFTAQTPSGGVQYRVTTIAGDKVFLRASQAAGTTRRFIVGTPAGTSFLAGTFNGASTEPAWGTVNIGSTAFSTSFVYPSGVTVATSGTVSSVGGPSASTGNILRLDSTAGSTANFFAVGSAKLGAMVSTRGSAVLPGYIALGVRQ
jgi:hypothetical protein